TECLCERKQSGAPTCGLSLQKRDDLTFESKAVGDDHQRVGHAYVPNSEASCSRRVILDDVASVRVTLGLKQAPGVGAEGQQSALIERPCIHRSDPRRCGWSLGPSQHRARCSARLILISLSVVAASLGPET